MRENKQHTYDPETEYRWERSREGEISTVKIKTSLELEISRE